jgi:hypothetical protein
MPAEETTAPAESRTFHRLRLFNAAMVPVHVVQGIAILALSTDFALPVTTTSRYPSPRPS